MSHLFGLPDVAFVTNADGTVTLLPGLPLATAAEAVTVELAASLHDDADEFHTPALTVAGDYLLPALVADDDAIYAVAIANIPLLSPALYSDADAFFAPVATTGSKTLSPPLVTAPEVFYSGFVTLVGLPGGPQQKLKPPPKHTDPDVIYAPSTSKHAGLVTDPDVVRAPVVTALVSMQPGLVTDDDVVLAASEIANTNNQRTALVLDADVIYGALLTLVLHPALLDGDDAVPAADVGWQVIAEATMDADAVYAADAYPFNELLPEPWMDEEHIDTYPFFVQQLEGGIPVKPREGTLKGSIKRSVSLKGSITTSRAA